jgi:exodeoxyribonuclease VIII
MPQELPSTGFHYGVPFEDYVKWDAVNISKLKPMADSPMHCRYEMDHPKESDEMDVGSALHVATFEPGRFEKEFYVGKEEYNASTNIGKAVKARELEEAAGRTYLRRNKGEAVDCESVEGMSASLHTHGPAKRFLEMAGQCEVSAIWKDPVTGLMCKCRFDKLTPKEASPFKRMVIVELKSTGKGQARMDRFGEQIKKWKYAPQAAYYMWAVKIITGEAPLHVFLAVENVPPYAANWGTLDDADLNTGSLQFRKWLNRYAECVKSGTWPGYSETPTPVFTMGSWANREEPQ